MYNELRKILAVFIAGTMLLGSVPMQAQEIPFLLSGQERDFLLRKREAKALRIAYLSMPRELKEKVFVKDADMTALRKEYRLLVPYGEWPWADDRLEKGGVIYIQKIADDTPVPHTAAARQSYALDIKTKQLTANRYPAKKEQFDFLSVHGEGVFGSQGYNTEISFPVVYEKQFRTIGMNEQSLFRSAGHFIDKEAKDEVVEVFVSTKELHMVTDNGKFIHGNQIILKANGVKELVDGRVNPVWLAPNPPGTEKLVPVKEYYKANLSTIRKLLAAVETKIHQRYPKYQGLFFKEFLKGDTKYMVAKLEKAAAKKATAKKAGQKAGKTALRSIGGAFFGIGLYAVLTATTANPVQAAEITVTPKSEIIKKTVAEFKDAKVKSGVEKLAMFADPNKMPLIVRDAKLLIEMGQYQEMLDANGLTVDEAAELIVNEMFAQLAAKEQAKQEVVKKVKHI